MDSNSIPFFSPSSFHRGESTSANMLDSPYHIIGESPLYNQTLTDSPYHIPSSTESPLHEPDQAPMYALTSLTGYSVSLCIEKPPAQSERSKSERTKRAKNLTGLHRKRPSNRNSGSAQVKRRRAPKNTILTAGLNDAELAVSVTLRMERGASEKFVHVDCDNSENHSEDSDYDSSDMEDAECGRKRRLCANHMDLLSSHYERLKEKFYTDKLSNIESRIENAKSGKCVQYLAQTEKEESKYHTRIKLADTVLKYKRKAAENNFCANEAFLVKEADEKIDHFQTEMRTYLQFKKREIHHFEHWLSDSSANELLIMRCFASLHKIFNATFPLPITEKVEDIFDPLILRQLTDKEIAEDLRRMVEKNVSTTTSAASAQVTRAKVRFRSCKNDERKKVSKAKIKVDTVQKTVMFNGHNIQTWIKLCVQQKGRKDFYGYASGVDKDGALIISSAATVKGRQRTNSGNAVGSSHKRVVTVEQIHNEEILIKPLI